MPECEICGEQVDGVYKCKNCGTRFCEDNGDASEMLCIYCLEDEGEGAEAAGEEPFEEDNEEKKDN